MTGAPTQFTSALVPKASAGTASAQNSGSLPWLSARQPMWGTAGAAPRL